MPIIPPYPIRTVATGIDWVDIILCIILTLNVVVLSVVVYKMYKSKD